MEDEGGYAKGGNEKHDPRFLINLSNHSMVAVTVQYRVTSSWYETEGSSALLASWHHLKSLQKAL